MDWNSSDVWIILQAILFVIFITQFGRIWAVIKEVFLTEKKAPFPLRLMAILGSGGHTGELLEVVDSLSPGCLPRIYVAADQLSITRARDKERNLGKDPDSEAEYCSILRIRNVGESFLKAVYRIPIAICQAFFIVVKYNPDLILCNGPGICFPICLIAKILNIICVTNSRIMFIESFCRSESLSLTGRLMVYLADDFFLQWNELFENCVRKYPKRSFAYFGRLQ